MKLLFTISQSYLQAFQVETENYSFYIQGYPSIKKAHEGLTKRNIGDILGFVYFSKSLPRNYKALVEFIERVDLIAPKDMIFLIAIQDGKDLDLLKETLDVRNLKMKVMYGWTEVTDIVIKSCLATFILQNYDPYCDTTLGSSKVRADAVDATRNRCHCLSYERVFSKEMLELLSKVNLTPKSKPQLQDTIINDLVLYRLSQRRTIYYRVRLAYIQVHFGNNELLDIIQNDLKQACGNYTLANAIYRHMQCIYNNAINNGGVYKEKAK